MLDKYIIKNGKKLRYGYTTGTCAAAAARAAVEMLYNNKISSTIIIDTPKGLEVELKIYELKKTGDTAECYVIKDSGDDPDCTDGIKIYARAKKTDKNEIKVIGGTGIGIVTKKGLPVVPGNPAINPVPMKMIISEVKDVIDDSQGALIEIFAPEGVEISKRTFNRRLGINGGISILGTTGIVEPMSNESIKESLALEVSMHYESGEKNIIFVPGNYGKNFATEKLKIKENKIITISNFLGFMLEQAAFYKMKKVLLIGHIGKLIKPAGGIFNTHSRVADARMEILSSNYGYFSGDIEAVKKIMESNTTEEALEYISDKKFYKFIADKISKKCMGFIHETITVETIIFSMKKGELAATDGAAEFINSIRGT